MRVQVPGGTADASGSSPIALERLGPDTGIGFWAYAGILAAATLTALLLLGGGDAIDAESRAATADDWWGALLRAMSVDSVRVVAAIAGTLLVFAAATGIRRVTQSPVAGGAAATLVALDPSFLVYGSHALPQVVVMAAAASSLALAASPRRPAHWLVWLPLTVGWVLEPWFVAWVLVVTVMMVFRGHIYISSRHLGTIATQSLAIPGVLAGIAALIGASVIEGDGAVCASGGFWLREVIDLGAGHLPVPSVIVWFGGLAAALLMGASALWAVGARFRGSRTPGRIQWKLAAPLPDGHGRSMWLLAFGVAGLPFAGLLIPAAGLAHAADRTGRDAPGFAYAILAAIVAFSLLILIRLWPLVTGADDPGEVLARIVPWGDVVGCA